MSHYTYRRQPRTGREDQITSPEELVIGMEIGVATIIEPVRRAERLAFAAAALMLPEYMGKGLGRRATVRKAWNIQLPHGLRPQYIGSVAAFTENGYGSRGLKIQIKRGIFNDDEVAAPGSDFAALPIVDEPTVLMESLEGVGLAPVNGTGYGEHSFGEVGRWNPRVVIKL